MHSPIQASQQPEGLNHLVREKNNTQRLNIICYRRICYIAVDEKRHVLQNHTPK